MSLFRKNIGPENIEVEIKRPKLRIIIVAALLSVGLLLIAYGIASSLSTKSGWQQIEVSVSGNAHAGGDFSFIVYFDGGFMDQSAKKLTTAYSEIAVKAYQIFDADKTFIGVKNLLVVNQSPNTAVEVEPELYQALQLLEKYQNRAIFLGPVYEVYRGLFLCQEDAETIDFDPHRNEEVRSYIEETLSFVTDPEHISLELLDNNQVCLHVSDEYAAYAAENDITVFLDLFWMRNAFAGDYMADALADYGISQAYLASNDGYIRCLDDTPGNRYRLALTEWQNGVAASPFAVEYSGPAAFAVVRGYPVNDADEDLYYVYENGQVVNGYINLEDGWNRMEADERVFYGYDTSCAEVMLKSFPEILAKNITEQDTLSLASDGVFSIFREGSTYVMTDPDVSLTEDTAK